MRPQLTAVILVAALMLGVLADPLLRVTPWAAGAALWALLLLGFLLPLWKSVADMGNDAKASGFDCQACGSHFSPEEGHALRAHEGERVEGAGRDRVRMQS